MNIFVRSLFCLPWMILINIQFSNDCFWLFCLALPLIFWSDSFQRFSVILEIPPLYDEFLQWNARGKWEWVNWKQTNSIAESHSQFFFFFCLNMWHEGLPWSRIEYALPLPPQWKLGVSTSGPPGKSPINTVLKERSQTQNYDFYMIQIEKLV